MEGGKKMEKGEWKRTKRRKGRGERKRKKGRRENKDGRGGEEKKRGGGKLG
jgi:hypothetical protein